MKIVPYPFSRVVSKVSSAYSSFSLLYCMLCDRSLWSCVVCHSFCIFCHQTLSLSLVGSPHYFYLHHALFSFLLIKILVNISGSCPSKCAINLVSIVTDTIFVCFSVLTRFPDIIVMCIWNSLSEFVYVSPCSHRATSFQGVTELLFPLFWILEWRVGLWVLYHPVIRFIVPRRV